MASSPSSVYEVFEHQKAELLLHLLKDDFSEGSTIIFLRSREGVHTLTSEINRVGLAVESIHGAQKIELRERSLQDLQEGKIRILVATESVTRDPGIGEIDNVIYFDFHELDSDYLQHLGSVKNALVTIVTQHEQNQLKKLTELVGDGLHHAKSSDFQYDRLPKLVRQPRVKGHKPNKTGSKPLQHKKPKLKNKGPRRKTGRTRKR